MALTYTSVEDFEAYVEGWETENSAALTRLLERAERDIDNVFGPIPRSSTTGLKVDPSGLQDWEAAALSRAVCAQAEYRFRVGDDELAGGRLVKRVKGPDFETEFADGGAGATTRALYGPKVRLELEPIGHLRGLSGYVRA